MDLSKLYRSIKERWTPEQAAEAILAIPDLDLPQSVKRQLEKARPRWKSSMATTFRGVQDLNASLKIAGELFPLEVPRSVTPASLTSFLDDLYQHLMFTRGSDFSCKFNRKDRKAKGLYPGHRAYNKRLRFLLRFADKCDSWMRVNEMTVLAQIAKTKLALLITEQDFSSDPKSAVFIAWFTAKLGVRSQFTWSSQVRAFDNTAEALLSNCDESSNWFAIAHVHPTPEVLAHLSDEEKGRLLGVWFDVMERSSKILSKLSRQGGYDLVNLVVQRGNDSSSWNEAAGAFNKAREGWINALYSMGMESVLDSFCPGKCLRLMAADVVFMHSHYGSGGLDPATKIWQVLPYPWYVMEGTICCTQQDVRAACNKHGVDSAGWVSPGNLKKVASYTPTPELVHGVTVASPSLAATLKKLKYFSGKEVKEPIVSVKKSYLATTLEVDED